MELNTIQKGMLAELKVQQRAMELGMTVYVPTDHSARYDAVIDDGQHLYRAQVKYCDSPAGCCQGAVSLELTSSHRSGKLSYRGYTSKEIDVLLVYVPRVEKILWLEPKVFEGRPRIQIRLEPTKNGQVKNCLFADDYVW